MKDKLKIRCKSFVLFSAIATLLVLLGTTCNAVFAQMPAQQVYEKAVNSTVTILADNAIGSGFFIAKDLVVTNFHVVDSTSKATILLSPSGERIAIEGFVAVDKTNDLVILKLKDYQVGVPLELATELPKPGEPIFVIGSPKGLPRTISDGIVSGLIQEKNHHYITITAPISSGNSGGPVLNEHAQVVGLATFMLKDAQNLNFAVPSFRVRELINENPNVKPLSEIFVSAILEQTNADSQTKVSFEEYSEKAQHKVNDFIRYVNVVMDKSNDILDVNTAIEQACMLFENCDRDSIQVSSLAKETADVRKFSIRTYFKRLKMLNYTKVVVSSYDVHYISNLKKAPDSCYYGVIAFTQKFEGLSAEGKLRYSDITSKTVEVKLCQFPIYYEGATIQKWDVRLKNIYVEQTTKP